MFKIFCFNISQQNTQPIEHLKFYPISLICENAWSPISFNGTIFLPISWTNRI